MNRRLVAAVVVVAAFAMEVAAVAVAVGQGSLVRLFPPDLGAGVVFPVVGAFLLVRGAVTRIAAILCVQGLGAAATTLCGIWRDVAAAAGPLHGAALWAAWADNLVWLFGVALLVPLALLFPDGRVASPGWRWPIRVVAGLAGLFVVIAVVRHDSVVDGRPEAFAPNPTAFLRFLSEAQINVAGGAVFLGFVLMLLVAVIGVVVRRRAATGVERSQLTCLLYGAALTVVDLVVIDAAPTGWWAVVLGLPAVVPMAVAVAIAVLRYRLYDIDKVVSRTVAYALALLVLGAVYVGVVAGLAALAPHDLGQVGVAAATLVVSIVALPLTRRVRRVVDRRFDRRRYDAERVATRFAAGLRARPDRGDVPTELLAVVGRTVAPAHAGVWLLTPRPAATPGNGPSAEIT